MPEHVGMEEALELLKKPRMGNVMLAFKRAKYMPEVIHEGPHPKKKREEKEHEGKNVFILYFKLYRVHYGQEL
jgi:hypothetical protein